MGAAACPGRDLVVMEYCLHQMVISIQDHCRDELTMNLLG
jgi:hypothetical protein